ncbi:phospholipase D-like domain-containing protein [Acidovorax sp. A1169]|uniref:phospholipase D-like domain-containing protein n=1 Tax=Acidovorax sp. A1169 TaxID=3059524 RepID=UPI002737E8D4|nr:phospholipase D-like domain-containing protein [Acidovorax sp. A1169]MDP4077673.1 phospholipase D-like domain-containing protein [Acidovorax sp. A1169]
MSQAFQVEGANQQALFKLRIHRGDGMALVAMNWKNGKPPPDFVGFAIEYKEPGGDRFFSLNNRIAFPKADGSVDKGKRPTRLAPIQKFRWVHFPRNAEMDGQFIYRVTPVFMNELRELSYGDFQEASLELRRETYPDQLNVAYTHGFVASQAFVDKYSSHSITTLLPAKADDGLNFTPSHPKAQTALAWMGFEARSAILEVLDQAIADGQAEVRAVLYDLNEPGVVTRLEKLGSRLKIIIDDSDSHGAAHSAETQAAERLVQSAGPDHVKRQHMGKLQHNKTVVVDGPLNQAVVCGSTNQSWRGFFVQNNNAIVLRGTKPVKIFRQAFRHYWENDSAAGFGATTSAAWQDLGLGGVDAKVCFNPLSTSNGVLDSIAGDVKGAESSLFFSLAFLYQTPGAIQKAIRAIKDDEKVFSYGISDRAINLLVEDATDDSEIVVDVQKPDGTVTTVSPSALQENVPEPFRSESSGGSGNRMHHKFIVIDFDKPTARVYMGSYNFSKAADTSNGENLLLIKDRRIAVSYMIEALRIFDHYHFRISQSRANEAGQNLLLKLPPGVCGGEPWWSEYYTDARKIVDREIFA